MKKDFVSHITILEKASKVDFISRSSKQFHNWLYGNLIWKSLEVLSGLVFCDRSISLYEQCVGNSFFRRVQATLIQEVLTAIARQNLSLLDHSTSPFGISAQMTIHLLRLPDRVFTLLLSFFLFVAPYPQAGCIRGNGFGEKNYKESLLIVQSLLQQGSCAKIDQPLLSVMLGYLENSKLDIDCHSMDNRLKFEDYLLKRNIEIVQSISTQKVICAFSLLLLIFAVLIQYIFHAYDVLMNE